MNKCLWNSLSNIDFCQVFYVLGNFTIIIEVWYLKIVSLSLDRPDTTEDILLKTWRKINNAVCKIFVKLTIHYLAETEPETCILRQIQI